MSRHFPSQRLTGRTVGCTTNPECARPRAQQREHVKKPWNNWPRQHHPNLLRPGTGALRCHPSSGRNGKALTSPAPLWCLIGLAILLLINGPLAARADDAAGPAPAASARDLYNAGTRQFQAGKLAEAETLLQNSVAVQDLRVQPEALYNLGCVRVAQGVDILKQNNNPKGTAEHADELTGAAGEASQQIDAAIASQNTEKMVMAYLRGGGVRREINAATKAVRQALESQQAVLAKWQRAAGDFRSAAELQSQNADAPVNAAATERAIAALIDKLNQLQQAGLRMKSAGRQLGEKLQQLKGLIPAPNMPPGAPGDDDDDEDMPGLKPGEQEGQGRTGEEIKISPEEAEQILNGYKLKGDHGLPFGQNGTATPKNRTGKNW